MQSTWNVFLVALYMMVCKFAGEVCRWHRIGFCICTFSVTPFFRRDRNRFYHRDLWRISNRKNPTMSYSLCYMSGKPISLHLNKPFYVILWYLYWSSNFWSVWSGLTVLHWFHQCFHHLMWVNLYPFAHVFKGLKR